jgi:hypothetical protein
MSPPARGEARVGGTAELPWGAVAIAENCRSLHCGRDDKSNLGSGRYRSVAGMVTHVLSSCRYDLSARPERLAVGTEAYPDFLNVALPVVVAQGPYCKSNGGASPGFPVGFGGINELHAAFLTESRTREHGWCRVQEIRVAPSFSSHVRWCERGTPVQL